ncbi:hypothetical protein WL29_22645 [Burkholderia ubonensis]|uniref:Uncharacterized protein n=1 Tax=Burkholderia ubonensis TaxID=101571 RepID=A0A119HFM8_9BURK|nr:hypothetical protein [Burkholderia ubonensis]KWA84164.1 hypothetical protein WL29_22645 [Burkholderia ubonensis]
MSHQGIKTPRPAWLDQVAKVTVKPEHAEGRSETGAAMAAIADAMGVEGYEPFAAGELMGVEIERGAGVSPEFVMMVSSGNVKADVERVSAAYGVAAKEVSLLSAYVMLTRDAFQGLAQLKPIA